MFEEELTPKKGFILVNVTKKGLKDSLPTRKQREGLEVGDFAQLLVEVSGDSKESETIWVEVVGVEAKKYQGFMRCNPDKQAIMEVLKWGDMVEFKPIHVLSVKERSE